MLRDVIRDVGPSLSPEEELGDLKTAEDIMRAREEEREAIFDKLHSDLKRGSQSPNPPASLESNHPK
jgi:kinetochore protein Spc24